MTITIPAWLLCVLLVAIPWTAFLTAYLSSRQR